MNYSGLFDAKRIADGSGLHSSGHVHVETVYPHPTHAPAGAIVVPDAQLLFNGDFKRSGVDLVLSRDGRELVLQDYFKGEKRAALSSPDGAHLTGDIIDALTGHTQFAQADASAAGGKVIGHVTKLAGTATATRNGVSITLHLGDNVEKGDVVQSGSDSTLGITFIDGTVFGLLSNARMVLNDMVYDPNGSNNSSLLSLVAGTISFVAGETAKHGDMKVDTPVATMGIRGTAVLVEIDFTVPGQGGTPDAKFQVLVEPDGTTGSYILFDKNTLTPIATVNQAGQQIHISQGQVSITNEPLSPDLQKLITDVFTLKFTDNSNPKTFQHFTDSITPQALQPIILANQTIAVPIIAIVNLAENSPPAESSNGPINSIQHIDQAPTVASFGGSLTALPDTVGSSVIDTASGTIRFADINAGDLPTVKTTFTSFTYQNPAHTYITATLNALQRADIAAVEANLVVTPRPDNNNNGSANWTYSVPNTAVEFLAAGETLTLTYTAEVDSNYAPEDLASFQTFTVTMTGTNDAPVITSSAPTIAFAGGISTPGGDLTAKVPTKGTLSFDDVNLTDTHTVSTALASAVLSGAGVQPGTSVPPGPLQVFETALSASIAADSTGTGYGTIDWSLANLPVYLADFIPKGDTLTLTYTVTVGDEHNATSTQDVVVTITGTDTAAVVWIATTTTGSPSAGLWSDPSNWETGTVPTASDDAIVITDQLIGLTPHYPVEINAPAFAKSLTMNDFGATPPELDNHSALTIGGTFELIADSIFDNAGTAVVGGLLEVLDSSQFTNSGSVTLANGGDLKDSSKISNLGTIELSGGTLNVLVDVDNAGGTIQVDGGLTLTLNGATISGGTISDYSTVSCSIVAADIEITGSSAINGGASLNNGNVTVEGGATLTLDNVTVTGTMFTDTASCAIIRIDTDDTLTLDGVTINGGTVTDSGTVHVDRGQTLKLNGVALSGGAISDVGTIEITGDSSITSDALCNSRLMVDSGKTLTLGGTTTTISGGFLTNDGAVNSTGSGAFTDVCITNTGLIEATSGILTIDAAMLLTITNSGTIKADRGELDITREAVTNSGTLQAIDDSTLKLTTVMVTSTGGTVTVGSGSTLDLAGAAISGGTLGNSGQINVSGCGNALDGVTVTVNCALEVLAGGALLLDQGTKLANGGGTLTVDGAATLTLTGASISGGTINAYSTVSDSILVGDIDVAGSSKISDVSLNKGCVTTESGVTLTLDNDTVTDTAFTDIRATGSIIQIDDGAMLTLDGVTINRGAINDGTASGTVTDAGTVFGSIDVTGSGKIGNASLNYGGVTIASGVTLTLDDDTVTGTTFTEAATGAILRIDDGTTLTLDGATINGGAIEDGTAGGTVTDAGAFFGSIDVTGSSKIGNASLNYGGVTVESGVTLTLDNDAVTGTTFTDAATGAILQIDDGTTLILSGVTIDSGTINDGTASGSGGTIDVIGASEIDGANLNNGHLRIEQGISLTLDNVTVTGTSFEVDGAISSATGNLILQDGTTISGSQLQIDSADQLTLNDATISGGTITDNGTIDVIGDSTMSGSTIDSGSTIGPLATPTYSWVDGTSGDWGTAADWSGGVVPGGKSNAAIGGTGTETVTVSSNQSVNVLTLSDANATLAVTNFATLSVDGGFAVSAAHAIDVSWGTLVVGGGAVTLDDTTLELGGAGFAPPGLPAFPTLATLSIQQGTALTLGPNLTLDGVDGQISGSGSLDNKGTITTVGGGGGLNIQINSSFSNEGTITFAAQGGTGMIAAQGFDNEGSIVVENGDAVSLFANGTFNDGVFSPAINNGAFAVGSGGHLTISGNLAGTGSLTIDDGGTLEVAGTLSDTVSFAVDAMGTLLLDNGSSFTGTLAGLALGDAIDFADATITSAVVDGDVLTVTLGNGQTDTITLAGPLPEGDTLQVQLDGNGGEELVVVTGTSGNLKIEAGQTLTLNGVTIDGGSVLNNGTIVVDGATTYITGAISGSGALTIEGQGALEIAAANGQTVAFAGTGGTLEIDSTVSGGPVAGISANSTGAAGTSITGAGDVSSLAADALDAVSAAGSITLDLSGSLTGALAGLTAIQNGDGDIDIATDGAVVGQAGDGILADQNASASGNILINGSGDVTGTGSSYSGILAEILNPTACNDIQVLQTADIAGGYDGILAITFGQGNIVITTGANADITGANHDAIDAVSAGSGDITVTTAAGDVLHSQSSGITAINDATTIDPWAASTISVTAYGTIYSGTALTDSGKRPAGVLASYQGAALPTLPAFNPDVFGDVSIYSFATIIAAAGDGLRASNYGIGDVTITDEAGTSISATGQYGISATNYGPGNITVTMKPATDGASAPTILSGGSGIEAANEATAISAEADSTIRVTATGTIHFGTVANVQSGSPADGIVAGYYPLETMPETTNTSVCGDVMVDNFAVIAPAAGNGAGSNAGIDAYTYGNGNVTVTDETGANVSGYVYGIIASTHEGLTGDVSVIVEENVTISSVTSYGIFAEDSDTVEGNVRVTMNSAGGEMIASGGSGILALNDAATTSHTSEVDVLAHGTILSGAALNGDGSPAAGILAGYDYNGTVDPDAHGSVTIDDYASITAAAGTDGIRGFNYGTGDIAITVEAGAVIDGPRFGVGAFGHDGGDITVTNDGSVTGGTDAIDAASTGDGTATIHNYGHLTGNVAAYNATFVNELHGDWSIDGSSDFTGASTLANCGTIESNGTSVVSGLSCIANSGSIEVETGSLDLSAPVSGTGTLTIDAGSTLELASEVSSGQTVTFSATTGTLKLDQAQNFHGTVSGLGTQDGTQAHSDQIDLVNINHDSADFSEQYDALTDTLTVSDGTNTADIHLTGSYTDANFYFVDDGNPVGGVNGTSGTIVYDPPVLSSPPAQAANGANLGIGASAANDVFVFAPSSSGPAAQHTITDFVAGLDKIDVSQFSTILAFANLNETQHGADTLLTIDSHDTLLLKNVTAASLHASDFIFHA